MQKIIGNEITVFLKGTENSILGDMSGILVDMSEESIYVQDSSKSAKIFVVPRSNIDYCTTDKLPPQRQFIEQEITQEQQCEQEQSCVIDCLDVYVNQQQVTSIPVPPTFKVDEWNESILRVLLGNPEVQNALAGKVQKGLEYFPGKVYIEIETITPPSQMPDASPGYTDSSNSFTMGGSPTEQYLNPMQMAARLNKVVKRGNDDSKTKV